MSRDTHFEQFKDHTLLKHFLLVAYLKRWATVLLSSGIQRVWFVDAFAGAGFDSRGNPGSPVLAAGVAQEVNREQFPKGVSEKKGMHVVAIESHASHYKRLQKALERWTQMNPRYVHVRDGSLEDRIDEFLAYVGDDPVLFFLDPFGIEGLSADLIRKAMKGRRNEILALFSDEGAVRLHGKATAKVPEGLDPIQEVLMNPSIFGAEADVQRLAEAVESAERIAAGYKSNPRALEILNRAYGGESWQDIIRNTPANKRGQRFRELYEQVLIDAGGDFTLPFEVNTKTGRHKYWLIHASKHSRAFSAMKHAMHRTRTQRTAERGPPSGSLLAEFSADTDVVAVADSLEEQFAGRTVSWAPDTGDTVQGFALEHTPLWLHEREALKAELKQRGWFSKVDRSQIVTFPASRDDAIGPVPPTSNSQNISADVSNSAEAS
jgi:three-Cys-motif partner protein